MLVIIPVVIIFFLVLPLFATVSVFVSGFIGVAVSIIRPLVILMFVVLPVFPALLEVRVAGIAAVVPSLYVGMVAILIVALRVFMVAIQVASLIVPLVLLCLWIVMVRILCDNWNCRKAAQYQEKPKGSGCNLHASSNVTALLSGGVSVLVKSPVTGGGLPVRTSANHPMTLGRWQGSNNLTEDGSESLAGAWILKYKAARPNTRRAALQKAHENVRSKWNVQRFSKKMVEAVGVEPTSENVTGQEPTYLVQFTRRELPRQIRVVHSERTRNAKR